MSCSVKLTCNSGSPLAELQQTEEGKRGTPTCYKLNFNFVKIKQR